MKRILFLAAALLSIQANAGVHVSNFKINFDKVVHIVLPTAAEIATAGSDYIEATIVPEAKNCVRVVAMQENFAGETNLSIVDRSGEVYSYQITYSADTTKLQSVFYPPKEEAPADQKVVLNERNRAMVIFPAPVKYLKEGNDFSIECKVTAAKNIVEVTAKDVNFHQTNFFVVDENDNEYNVIVDFGNAPVYVYNFNKGQKNGTAIVKDNIASVEELAEKALAERPHFQQTGMSKNGMDFAIKNVFVNEEYIILVLTINNRSYIDYNIDFMKYFFVDKKVAKSVVQQEIGQEPIRMPEKYVPTIVKGKDKIEFPLFFKKFTIPDDKNFRIEIQEKNGGRNIFFNLQNNDAKKAIPLK